MNDFNGKSVLVTGAAGGIGRAICKKMAQQGATVIATDFNQAGLDELASELKGTDPFLVCGDLADADFVESLPALVQQRHGSLGCLINNAGVMRRGNILAASDADFDFSIKINVEAVFRLSRAAIDLMRDQAKDQDGLRGSIVNMASCWGVHPGPDHLVYCMTKAAVASMTQCLARDHAKDGIRVNAVCPNEVNTQMLRTGFEMRGLDPDSAVSELNASVPIGRIAEPEDIADTVAFLASNQARYVCGALLEVNGAKPVG